MKAITDSERIDLLRSGSVVSSFAGAFGNALRETRLTAMLGYLVALQPERFCNNFAFHGRPLSVSLEARHATDRSDIWVETAVGCGVVEAKVNATDPFRQAAFTSLARTGHDWRKTTRSILFLSTPRLVFNPPVLKEKLVKGSGFLNQRFFSFDRLFEAWGC